MPSVTKSDIQRMINDHVKESLIKNVDLIFDRFSKATDSEPDYEQQIKFLLIEVIRASAEIGAQSAVKAIEDLGMIQIVPEDRS